MKKRIFAVLTLAAMFLLFAVPVMAQADAAEAPAEDILLIAPAPTGDVSASDAEPSTIVEKQYVVGLAENFDEISLNQLNRHAQNIHVCYGFEPYVFFAGEVENLAKEAANFHAANAVGPDGLTLAISNEAWYIHTAGRAAELFAAEDLEALWSAFYSGYTDAECITSYYDAIIGALRTKGETPVLPERSLPRLVDEADLLFDWQEEELLAKLNEISERQQLDVAIVTVSTIMGKNPQDYADDYYDYNGFGFGENRDGVLLLVNMGERDWHMTTTGYGIHAITDAGVEYISEKFLPDLSDGYYADSFDTFATLCDEFVTQAKTGEPYDYGNMPKGKVSPLWIPGSAAGGALAGQIPISSMKRKLKSVGKQKSAARYFNKDSLNFAARNDNFLYSNVKRVYIQPSESRSGGGSSTHFGSSGSSHGGGGGKF